MNTEHEKIIRKDAADPGMDSTTTATFRSNGFSTDRASATLLFVVKDEVGFHISDPFGLTPSFTLDVIPFNLPYKHYDPYTSSESTEVGTVGESSSPAFSSIKWVGFCVDAYRGTDIANGVNLGVWS